MDVQDVVDKIARTKEQKYGDPYYTNIEKLKEVDPLNTTPMDALKILFELKQIDK